MCITKTGRSAMLDIALTCLRKQSYPRKEAIVVYDADNTEAAAVVRQHAAEAAQAEGTRVKAVVNSIGVRATLGEVRRRRRFCRRGRRDSGGAAALSHCTHLQQPGPQDCLWYRVVALC